MRANRQNPSLSRLPDSDRLIRIRGARRVANLRLAAADLRERTTKAFLVTIGDHHSAGAARPSGHATSLKVAIVGLGPRGLCALERIVNAVHAKAESDRTLEVHIIEPERGGVGIYDLSQPDYLVMNNSCGDIVFGQTSEPAPYGLGLHEWAVTKGYVWVGNACTKGALGRRIRPEDFLPRRLMGEYLDWLCRSLLITATGKMGIVRHRCAAIDVIRQADGRERVLLANGDVVVADHVILTFGHVQNAPSADLSDSLPFLPPYPANPHLNSIAPQARVAICGMGLVGVDVVSSLTLGRGGQFIHDQGRLKYLPSGREPRLRLFSRSGLPYRPKTSSKAVFAPATEPVALTHQKISELRGATQKDFRREVLPLLFDEMTARFYVQSVFRGQGAAASSALQVHLQAAAASGRFLAEVEPVAAKYGRFDAPTMFFGDSSRFDSGAAYQAAVQRMILRDLAEDIDGVASPATAAADTFRSLRDPLRTIVEYDQLSAASYHDFHGDIRTRINRLVAGPPGWRLRQLVALAEAGVLAFAYGPNPRLERVVGSPTKVRIASTQLSQGVEEEVDFLVRGYLDDPRLDFSESPLVSNLCRSGRLAPHRYGALEVGSVSITEDAHPRDRDGNVHRQLWLFGALTEGVRYFTHYVPSPTRGARAFDEIDSCVREILS